MAYAIIDVPSTGNARFSQSRFLRYRQLPLFLAALILAEWWALFRNTHGRELFNSSELLFKFVVFSVTSYLAGGLLATGILSFRKDKGGDQRVVPSFLRLVTILLTTAFGGVCFWAIATHVFLTPAQHAVNYVCFAPALFLAVLLLINFLFTGLASWVSEDEDREWWGRSAAWILITIIGWIVVNMIVLWGAQVLTAQHDNQLGVFLGKVEANPAAKAVLAAFGGMTGVVGALLTLRSKVDTKVGGARASQWP